MRRFAWLLVSAFLLFPALNLQASGNRLLDAVESGNTSALRSLVRRGVDVNIPDVDGTAPLHIAVHKNNSQAVDILLHAGADLHVRNRYGATPLFVACLDGNSNMIEKLIAAGADPNEDSVGGEPPIFTATSAGNVSAVRALVTHGADVNRAESWRGQTALMRAAGEQRSDLVTELLALGAKIDSRSHAGLTSLAFAVRQGDVESTRILINAGADLSDPLSGGVTPLSLAINNNYPTLAALLLDSGADPNLADSRGNTSLHVAVRKRANEAEPVFRSSWLEVIRTMLANGADANARTGKPVKGQLAQADPRPAIDTVELGGITPFWLAAKEDDLEVVSLLHEYGANPTLTSLEGTNPLMVAAGLGYLGGVARKQIGDDKVIELLTLLIEWGNDVNAVNAHQQTAIHGAVYAASPALIQFLADHGAKVNVKDAIGRTPFQIANDNKVNKYRTNQDLDPAQIEASWRLLRTLTPEQGAQ